MLSLKHSYMFFSRGNFKKTWYMKMLLSLVNVFLEGNISECVRDFLVILETEILWLET